MEQVMWRQRHTAATLLRSPVTFVSSAEFSYRNRLIRKWHFESKRTLSAKPRKRFRMAEGPRGVKLPPPAATTAGAAAATPLPTTIATNIVPATEPPNIVTPDVPTAKRHQQSKFESRQVAESETNTKRLLFPAQSRDSVPSPLVENKEGETAETEVTRDNVECNMEAKNLLRHLTRKKTNANDNHAYFPSKPNNSESKSNVVDQGNESSRDSEVGIEESQEETIQTMVV